MAGPSVMTAADIAAAGGAEGYFPIACRTGATYARDTASAQTIASRTRHVLPFGAVDVIPVYAGWKLSPSELSMAYPAAVHIGVEPVWGTDALWGSVGNGANVVRRATKDGAVDLTIPTDDYLMPEPISINAAAGTAIGCRIHVPSGTGVSGSRTKSSALGEYSTVGTGTDNAWGGAYVGNGGLNSMIQPLFILGRTPDRMRHPAVVIIGDSNGFGTNSVSGGSSNFDTLDGFGGSGWVERSLGISIPYSNLSAPGDRLNYLMNFNGGASGRRFSRGKALKKAGFTHVVHALNGTNDALGAALTLAQIQDLWINWTAELVGGGLKVWAVTPFPNTSSTDAFATAGNQTITAAGAILQQMADWIRANAVSYGCERVVDVRAAVDPTNSGKWRTDLIGTLGAPPTYDGTHNSQAMLVWLGAQGVITPSMFTL
jgi:hypothetical protein